MKKVYFYSLDVQHIIGFCSKSISNTRIKLRTFLFSLIFNDEGGVKENENNCSPEFSSVHEAKQNSKVKCK